MKVLGTLARAYASKHVCIFNYLVWHQVCHCKQNGQVQLMTDITLYILFEEPVLIQEMIAESASKLLLSRC